MSILNWLKISAIALIAALLAAVKILLSKNAKLKQKVETKEKRLELKVKQQKVKDEVREDEPEQVEELKKDDGRSRADRLNSVLNDPDA